MRLLLIAALAATVVACGGSHEPSAAPILDRRWSYVPCSAPPGVGDAEAASRC